MDPLVEEFVVDAGRRLVDERGAVEHRPHVRNSSCPVDEFYSRNARVTGGLPLSRLRGDMVTG